MEPFVPLIFVGFVTLAIIGAVFSYLAEKKRREAFQALAGRLGLTYVRKDAGIADRYRFLDKLRQGEGGRYALNIVRGNYRNQEVLAFDYHFITRSRDSKGRTKTQHHYFSCFILLLGRSFPELRIYPEGFFSKFGQALGFDDIDFESIEFSKKFVVRSPDKKFAYDICHTRMMEYLLQHPDLSLEIENEALCMASGKRLDPSEVEERLNQLFDIHALFPAYLFESR